MKSTAKVAMGVDRVRQVKKLLIAGHRVADLARFFEVSPETISRIKRGATHKGVVVDGEAALRPANVLEEVAEGQTVPRGLSELDAQAMDATLARMLAVQKELAGDVDPVEEAKAQVARMQEAEKPVEQLSAAEFRRRVEEGEV